MMAFDGLGDSGFQLSESDVASRDWLKPVLKPKDRLVVALDTATADDARKLIQNLGDKVGVYKIGLELVMSGEGLDLAHQLKEQNKEVFLDMKLLDIGNTVEKAVANVARAGFHFLTVHGKNSKVLDAAMAGRRQVQPDESHTLKLLAVTVLTDQDGLDLEQEGIMASSLELAVKRAKMAEDAGFDGVIASGHEAAAIRNATRNGFIIKVPGIRPAGSEVGDQTRIMTPAQAMKAGATYIVVGRPIYQAPNPAVAAQRIIDEIAQANP